WGYQLLSYLEEGALKGLVTTPQIRGAVVPLYVCPSRGMRKISSTDATTGTSFQTTLTDYGSAMPYTKILSTDTTPPLDPGAINPYFQIVDAIVTKPGGSPSYSSGPPVNEWSAPTGQDNGVYDGVIVRSPFHATDSNPFTGELEGNFLSGVP